MWEYTPSPTSDELYHYGVKGMKWGVRKARGHAGPGRYLTKKRQKAGDKRDLDTLNKGGHLSVGLTKKRQAAYDARDRAAIEKRMSKGIVSKNPIEPKSWMDRQHEKSQERLKKNGERFKKLGKDFVNKYLYHLTRS